MINFLKSSIICLIIILSKGCRQSESSTNTGEITNYNLELTVLTSSGLEIQSKEIELRVIGHENLGGTGGVITKYEISHSGREWFIFKNTAQSILKVELPRPKTIHAQYPIFYAELTKGNGEKFTVCQTLSKKSSKNVISVTDFKSKSSMVKNGYQLISYRVIPLKK